MKLRIQAQYLQPGDIVGSGERIIGVLQNSTKFASNKVMVTLRKGETSCRSILWGKYTIINVKRAETKIKSLDVDICWEKTDG